MPDRQRNRAAGESLLQCRHEKYAGTLASELLYGAGHRSARHHFDGGRQMALRNGFEYHRPASFLFAKALDARSVRRDVLVVEFAGADLGSDPHQFDWPAGSLSSF